MAMTLPTINTSKKKKADNVDEDEAPSGADAMKILKKMRFAYPDWIALIDSYNVFVLWLRDIRMDASECEAVRSVDHNSSLLKLHILLDRINMGTIVRATIACYSPRNGPGRLGCRASLARVCSGFCSEFLLDI
jgi:hypothetical protein